ncbi:MoxR-like ATPase [Sphingobacterium alimentarium]|uniref:MoxR-like ATPase n=1 Tax=Sphingobacterium alimentarium TaxID=797292 RepID=A0A4R3VYR4_9SPHI|nr:MoxR family ATPase [Sphingobacterium alimentarium]TCV18922.1 MoxR-like ATPase [Sphingobacterium alimentarium]
MMEQDNLERYKPDFENRIDLSGLQAKLDAVRAEVKKVIIGQDKVINMLLLAILAGGHSLIEGLPGVAKTLTAKLIAKSIRSNFKRIQFTPDLMPSDVTGSTILDIKSNEFEFRKGPIFGNIILIDEINRAPAKTQSSLFECMSERQVTVDGTTYPMANPFIVFATQNPIEHEGTYRLPEAQLDRFLFKIEVNYPDFDQELLILQEHHLQKAKNKEDLVQEVVSIDEVVHFQHMVKMVYVHDDVLRYIAQIIAQTRTNPYLYLGASPRASIAVLEASKANAALQGRDFVTPEDVKYVAEAVLAHRIQLTPEKEMEGFTPAYIVQQLIENVEIPR